MESFHVDPTCSPTRSALMTGRYSGRVGVWHTIMGRNMFREDETTIDDVFSNAGYCTGIFGKWYLGDNYAYGAQFRGFDDAIVHFAGGVGQTPGFWGNDYFEDHYFDNGQWRQFQGYSTDVLFREALRFIRESKDEPFFLYLPTNAAHFTRPHVPERYKANIIEDHSDVVDRLHGEYENWWNDISQRFDETTPLYIGAEQQNPVQLDAHDWFSSEVPPWNQPHILERQNSSNGPWTVRVERAGHYTFVLRERSEIANYQLTAIEARLRIGDHIDETKTIDRGAIGVRFEVELEAGDTEIKTWLKENDGTSCGAYYIDVYRLSDK